jgi:VAD1 Analog of StAR-related lipid transfer domain
MQQIIIFRSLVPVVALVFLVSINIVSSTSTIRLRHELFGVLNHEIRYEETTTAATPWIGDINKSRSTTNSNNLSSNTIRALQISGGSTKIDVYSHQQISNPIDYTENKSTYPTIVIPETLVHGCADIDSFFDLFLKKNAKYSLYDKFLQSQGDTNMNVQDWANYNRLYSNSDESLWTRTVRYLHPLKVPLAPSWASARREQTMRHYGIQNGVIIESKTFVEDVPLADCFYSAERITILPGSVPNSISIIVDFGVTFLKNTIIQKMIKKSANNKVSELYRNMMEYIQESLAQESSLNAYRTTRT